jgi:hypothetical protein
MVQACRSFLATFLSPVGVLLIGGLIHDYAYKFACLKPKNSKDPLLVLNQQQADKIFRDINIEDKWFSFLKLSCILGIKSWWFRCVERS